MMLLSSLWHGLLMSDFYDAHSPTMRQVPLMRIIGLGYFLLATLMAVIYPKGYEGDPAGWRAPASALTLASSLLCHAVWCCMGRRGATRDFWLWSMLPGMLSNRGWEASSLALYMAAIQTSNRRNQTQIERGTDGEQEGLNGLWGLGRARA